MTFKQKVLDYLKETIYFEDDVNALWEVIQVHDKLESMKKRWNDEISGYPPTMLPLIMIWVNKITLNWLTIEKPLHFLIPFFKEKASLSVPELTES